MVDLGPTPGKDVLKQELRKTCDSWLQHQPETLARAIRICAIPLRVDRQLLTTILEKSQMDEAIAALQAMEFAEWEEDTLHLHPYVRSYLLSSWLEEKSLDFRLVNHLTLEYYTRLLAQAPEFEQPFLQREVIYHRLLVDETAGLDYLRSVVDELLDRRLLDSTQEVLQAANELLPWLSLSTQQWLRYDAILLDLAYGGGKQAALQLTELQREQLPTVLDALINSKQAELLLHHRQWTEAIRMLDRCRKVLLSADARRDTARLTLAIGEAYLSLAEHSGGYRPVRPVQRTLLQRAGEIIANLPFLLYSWLVRRVSFLGTPLTQSIDYQDWIVAYLLVVATRFFRQAQKEFDQLGDRRSAVEARLATARLELIAGRWSRATKLYHALLEEDYVRFSPYRMAQVQLGLGSLAYFQGRYTKARQALDQARDAFLRARDDAMLILTDDLIGRSAMREGQVDQAADALLEALDACERYDDPLSATRVAWSLELLAKPKGPTRQKPIQDGENQRVQERLAGIERRVYLTRFPEHLLHRFRQIALLWALPLSFPLTAFLGIIFTLSLVTISESLVRFILTGGVQLRWIDYIELFIGAVLPGPAMLWLYRLVYTGLGGLYVRRLGRDLDPIQGEQPDVIETSPGEIYIHRRGQTAGKTLNWETVSEVHTVNYTLWRKPNRLLSSFFLSASADMTRLQGITDGYDRLWNDVRRRLPESTRYQLLDFSFLRSIWVMVTVLTSLLAAVWLNQTFGPISITAQLPQGPETLLGFSSLLLRFLLIILFILPGVIMWRLLLHRMRLQKRLPGIPHSVPFWALALAAVVSTLFGILGIFLMT